jgi:hypothetical protein
VCISEEPDNGERARSIGVGERNAMFSQNWCPWLKTVANVGGEADFEEIPRRESFEGGTRRPRADCERLANRGRIPPAIGHLDQQRKQLELIQRIDIVPQKRLERR